MGEGMKRIGGLKESFLSFEHLYKAFKRAYKSTKTKEANSFAYHVESSIFDLQEELSHQTYKPEPYRYFTIYEPKERIISVATFKDRVVHHALIGILEPIYEKRFISDSYATRKHKGTHKAVLKAQSMMKQNAFYLKSDIKQYFPSICHETLKHILRRTIKDQFILDLCDKIIDLGGTNYGLPIGNLTSQFFANVYLNQFDYFIKETLKIKCYIRYMDDFVIFDNNKQLLLKHKEEIKHFLCSKLQLKLKESQTMLNTNLHGCSFLGVRVFPNLIRIKRENLIRTVKKIKKRQYQFINQQISNAHYDASMNSLLTYLKYWHMNTRGILSI
jgi:RNA-directed DNA polymerase